MKKIKIKSVLLMVSLFALFNGINAQDEVQQGNNLPAEEVEQVVATENNPDNAKEQAQQNLETAENLITNYEQAEVKEEVVANPSEAIDEERAETQKVVEISKISSLEETILFRLMQDHAFLVAAAKTLKTSYLEHVQFLAFENLNQKLFDKLIELAEKEELWIFSKKSKIQSQNEKLNEFLDSSPDSDEKNCWSDFQKSYPNLSDLFALFSDSSFKIELCPQSVLRKSVDFQKEISSIKEIKGEVQGGSDALKLIYEEELEKYKSFIKENEEILKKVETVMNSGKLRKKSKQCVTYKNKERCTENAIKEFASLRELMEYVQTL